MKVLMRISAAKGYEVTGSDAVLSGHDAAYVKGADLVIYSSAISDSNPELIYAKGHGIEIMSRAEYLGQLAKKYETVIAVAGSHGKTTCTAMLGCIFARLNPTVHLGGAYGGECGRVGGERIFITEACEYRRNFLHLSPRVSVVLNVGLDHTDYYRDLTDVTDAFTVFSMSAPVRIVSGDDPLSEPLRTGKYITFGLSESCDYRAEDITPTADGIKFTLCRKNTRLGEIALGVLGRHNALNALAAAATALTLGLRFDEVKRGLSEFKGADRRLSKLGREECVDFYTDYAHHPHEIECLYTALRDAGYEKVCVAFEPHTYTRTQSLMGDFSEVLAKFDDVLLASIYAAREDPVKGVSSQVLCRSIMDCGKPARCFDTYFELNEGVKKVAEKYVKSEKKSAIVYCGAGTINTAYNSAFLSKKI